MYIEKDNILNKGVPTAIPHYIDIDVHTLLEHAIYSDEVKKQIDAFANANFDFMDNLLTHKSHRKLRFRTNFIISYQKETKSNELVMDASYIIRDIIKYLNAEAKTTTVEELYFKCEQLSRYVSETKLAKKFPLLYELYLEELKLNQQVSKYAKNANLKQLQTKFNNITNVPNKIETYLEDSVKINNLKTFCKIYSNIIKEILDKIQIIDKHFLNTPINIFRNNLFIGDNLEADIVIKYINAINETIDINEKQKYLYYLTSYFNSNRHWINSDICFKLKDKIIKFDDLYNSYIDILINNPELKIVNYERKEFDTFTQEEIDEYMDLELSDAKANWLFLPNGLDEERASRAIYNGIKNITNPSHRNIKKEELKELYIKKKFFFDNTLNYRTIEGINTFDGYIAFVYPNGKVILERFFEKRTDGTEVIAVNQAIYVMNINEFYSLTNLSKTKIIRDNLCKRYIHKGDWETKVLNEINATGHFPDEEYKKLVLANKIKDSNQ